MARIVRWLSRLLLWVLVGAAALWLGGCAPKPLMQGGYSLRGYWSGSDIPGGGFDHPFAVAIGPDGSVYVTDAHARVVRLTAGGKFLTQWGQPGKDPGEFSNPSGLVVTANGDVYVSDYDLDRAQKFTADGKFLLQFGRHGSGPGDFNAPGGLSVDQQGNVYVADFYNDRIEEFSGNGKFIRTVGHPGRVGKAAIHYPTGLAALPNGGLLVADAYNYELQWFDGSGEAVWDFGYHLLWLWPRPAAGDSGFNVPTGVAVGPTGLIHVADSANHRIVMLSAEGKFLAKWKIPNPNPRIYSPEQIAVSPDGKTAYATDLAANRVIVLSVEGPGLSD